MEYGYYDEIELEYTMYLAEQEMFNNLISLSASVCNESVGLVLVQEDFKDTVNTYIEKIIMGIQKAWNTFKEKVMNAAVKPVLDAAAKRIADYDGSLVVQYWHTYDMNKFDALSMVDFDINLLKSCESKTDYYNKAFGAFFVDKEKSLKTNIIDLIINTENGDHQVTGDEMNNMYDFCTRRFKEATTKLGNDIDNLNKNINTVKYTLKVTEPGEEAPEATAQSVEVTPENSMDMLVGLYESCQVLTEAPKAPGAKANDDTKSVKVVDKGTAAGEGKGNNNIKMLTWYLSGNTDVFSAKMKILRLRYLDCIKIFKAAFPLAKKKEKTENEVEVKQTYKMKQIEK